MNGQKRKGLSREEKERMELKHACLLQNLRRNVIKSLREDVHVSNNFEKLVRLVERSPRERMVALDCTDTPFFSAAHWDMPHDAL